jgi:hypothetical protein
MGSKRIGLARVEALIENLKREISMGAGTILSGLKGVQMTTTSVTATDTGVTIEDGVSFVSVAADSDANHIVILPTPTPGTIIYLTETGTTGYELRSSDPANVAINGGSGADAESAVPGTATYVRCVCVSATSWIANMFDADGDEAKLPAAG